MDYKCRVGETLRTKQGCNCTILEYFNAINITVKFEDGTIIEKVEYGNFKKQTLINPNHPTVYGVGWLGIGKYGSKHYTYKIWHSMMQRCYDEKYQNKEQTYKGCTVCIEWQNFQNFAKWYEENPWNEDFKILDKDLLIKGNKEYSPNACVIVNQRLNNLLTKSNKIRGEYFVGVHYSKREDKYSSQCSVYYDGKKIRKWLGYFETEIEAFKTYKQFKEQYIKQVADEYKEKYPNFPQRLYDAMYNYEVYIDD